VGRARRTPRWRVDRLPHPALPLLVALDDDDAILDIALAARAAGPMQHAARHRGGSARAVGRAGGADPLPIVIPCHRVIGATGELAGSSGGLPIERWLLQLEQHRLPPAQLGLSA